MENVLYKISYPAGIHAQTAAEAAIRLHAGVRERLDEIDRVELWSHAYGISILDKKGPLRNAADRDHCLQYIAAIGLIHGRLIATDYEDAVAADPRIDALRDKMVVVEEPRYTREFLEADKRSNANAIRVHFSDGSSTDRVEIEYPVGHTRRREEGRPLLMSKFERNVGRVFAAPQSRRILALCEQQDRVQSLAVPEFVDALVPGATL
jgi:2-methylcitrate dehydratase